MDLTDEIVIRTLAEFMGWECDGDPLAIESLWRNTHGDFPNHQFSSPPEYLTSYDALAPVWRKCSPEMQSKVNDLSGAFTVSDLFRTGEKHFAYSLAEAIIEAREADNG